MVTKQVINFPIVSLHYSRKNISHSVKFVQGVKDLELCTENNIRDTATRNGLWEREGLAGSSLPFVCI